MVTGALVLSVFASLRSESPKSLPEAPSGSTVALDSALGARSRADDLTILRRLHLALVGSIPSLEEIRRFEELPEADRLDRWTVQLLADPRHHHYFAERLARAYVGTEDGAFITFRRDRFVDHLERALADHTPYDRLTRDLIDSRGLWTGRPATNFVTAAIIEGDIDRSKLAGRTVRAFLGQRMDCAQCHDHPFEHWTRAEFTNLAAFYADTTYGPLGVRDTATSTRPADVPFGRDWLPATGPRRERLAAWVTDPRNRRFARACVNRMWALLLGRPLIAPVDDLPDPGAESKENTVLDRLAEDFSGHDYDLRRLLLAITRTDSFRAAASGEQAFPMTRLRPEQLIGALLQAASAHTIDDDASLPVRVIRLLRQNSFVKEYGDLGVDELDEGVGTIPQALLRMNGKLPAELIEANLFTLTGRVAAFTDSNEVALSAIYLAFLTRRPSEAEKALFLPRLESSDSPQRRLVLEDVAWVLINSPELSWNH